MNYSCIIIDDNEIERDLAELYLDKIGSLNIKAVCSNAVEAMKVLANENIDIVFSDIDMPDISGIALLKTLKNPPVFIFITSHLEHAVESFELDALDFIPKPISIERLLKSVNKAINYLDLKSKNHHKSVENMANEDGIFFVKETKGYTRLNYDEIVYIESLGDFSKLFTPTGVHITLINLKNLEHQLPKHYFRIHKQYIINFHKILSINTYEVVLENDFKVPLSISYRDQILALISDKTLIRSAKKPTT